MAKSKKSESSDETEVPRIIGPKRSVLIPGGPCPVKLEGTSKEQVLKWATAVLEEGQKECLTYLPDALRYWVRSFYIMFSPQYNEVCLIIGQHFGENTDYYEPNYTPKKYSKDVPSAPPINSKPAKSAGVDSFEIGDDEIEEEEIKVSK
jgi:hypothetical protein